MCTIDNNKLIAEFMGCKQSDRKEVGANLIGHKYEWYLKDVDVYYINGNWHGEDNLLFHTDWNWLISAVIKCKERQFFGSNSLITRLNNALVQADIDLVYEQVIEFINYYNKQQDDTINNN